MVPTDASPLRVAGPADKFHGLFAMLVQRRVEIRLAGINTGVSCATLAHLPCMRTPGFLQPFGPVKSTDRQSWCVNSPKGLGGQ